jgi:predicted transcriptional regulator
MSTDLVTVGPNMPLERAVSMMIGQGISCLPVLADETLMGILTNTDLHLLLQILLETIRQSSLEKSLAAAVSSPQI